MHKYQKKSFIKTSEIKVDNKPSITKGNETEKNPYTCEHCMFRTNTKINIDKHYTLAHFQPNFIANPKKVPTIPKEDLAIEKLTCDKCKYKAGSATGLEAHIAFSH